MGSLSKLICRTSFVAACLLPVGGSLGYSAWQYWSLGTLQRGNWLVARLGVEAQIESLRPSRPGLTIADSVKLFDPETGQLLASCQSIEFRHGPHATAISIENVSISSEHTMALWEVLHDRVLRQSRILQQPILVSVDRISLDHPAGDVELSEWRMECSAENNRRQARISFRSGHQADASTRSTQITIVRDAGRDVPVTQIAIHAPDADINGCLLSGPSSCLSQMGDQVRFRGEAWVDIASNVWRGEIAGQVTGIQMQRILDDRFPYGLAGTAEFDIQQAVFENNRLQVLAGACRMQKGTISLGLIQSMRRMGLQSDKSLQARSEPGTTKVSFDELAAWISVSADGVSIRGACNRPEDGSVIIAQSAPIVRDDGSGERRSNFTIISAPLDRDDQEVLFTEIGDMLWRALPFCAPFAEGATAIRARSAFE